MSSRPTIVRGCSVVLRCEGNEKCLLVPRVLEEQLHSALRGRFCFQMRNEFCVSATAQTLDVHSQTAAYRVDEGRLPAPVFAHNAVEFVIEVNTGHTPKGLETVHRDLLEIVSPFHDCLAILHLEGICDGDQLFETYSTLY